MSAEIDVLMRIIKEGSIRRAVSLGLEERYFSDPVATLTWRRMLEFSNKQATLGETPSLEYITRRVPNFPANAKTPEASLGELIEAVRTGALDRSLRGLVLDMDKILREFKMPEMALEHAIAEIKRASRTASLPSHLAMDIGEACSNLREEYDNKANGGGLSGIPFPWDPLNNAIGGLVPGTFSVVYAPSKHGKTWMALEIGAVHPYLFANARVLVISCEMPIAQIYRRVLARMAEVDYNGVVNGTLADSQRERYFAALRGIEQEQNDAKVLELSDGGHRAIRVIRPSARTGAGIDSIRSAVEVFEPDLLFVDSVYRLADDKGGRDYDWRGLQANMAALKDMSAEYGMPVLVTAQANRKGWTDVSEIDFDEYGDIGMGSSFIQEADAVIRLHKFRMPDNTWRMLFTLPAVRESEVGAFTTHFNPCTDFRLDVPNVTPELLKAMLAGTPGQMQGQPLMVEEAGIVETTEPVFMPAKRGGKKGGLFG
jgi:DnaB-like helicase C terminal domain